MNFLNVDTDYLSELIVDVYGLPVNAQSSGILSKPKPFSTAVSGLFIGDKPFSYPAGPVKNTDTGFSNPANFTTTGGFKVAGGKLSCVPTADGEYCQQSVGAAQLPDANYYLISFDIEWNSYTSGKLELCFDDAPFVSGDGKTLLSLDNTTEGKRRLFKAYAPQSTDFEYWRFKSAEGAVFDVDIDNLEIRRITGAERLIYFGLLTPGGNPQSVFYVKQYGGKTLNISRINCYDNASSLLLLFDEIESDYDFHGLQFLGYEFVIKYLT